MVIISFVRRIPFGITAWKFEGFNFLTSTFSKDRSKVLICAETSVLLCIPILQGLAKMINMV